MAYNLLAIEVKIAKLIVVLFLKSLGLLDLFASL